MSLDTGGIWVATAELAATASMLSRIGEELAGTQQRAAAVGPAVWALAGDQALSSLFDPVSLLLGPVAGTAVRPGGAALPGALAGAAVALDGLVGELQRIAAGSTRLGALLRSGALEYENGEAVARMLMNGDLDRAAYSYGRYLGGHMGLIESLAFGAGRAASPPDLLTFAGDSGLTSQEAALAVRVLADTADDVLLGLTGQRHDAAYAPATVGGDIAGVAAAILAMRLPLIPVRYLPQTEISVTPERRAGTTAPTVLFGLAARVPISTTGGAQIRIERYGVGSDRRWVVYLTGTIDLDPLDPTNEDVFDFNSDVAAMAGDAAASQEATLAAMAAAGIRADDPVIIAGHSQGGLIAARLAQSGEFNIRGLVTFGAPIGNLHMGAGGADIPVIAIEHTEDIVPALAGLPVDHAGEPFGIYRREAFAVDEPPGDSQVPAHDMRVYARTASYLDRWQGDATLDLFRDRLAEVCRPGEQGSVAWWRAERTVLDPDR